jgi:hypothetical protein
MFGKQIKSRQVIIVDWRSYIMATVEQVLSMMDPGDDMQRRLRYQASYGALLCLDLLADEEIVEIFCEHHEDFLVKKSVGQYVGVQVKTRLPEDGEEESVEIEEISGIEVSTLEVVIDEALAEFQRDGTFPKKKKGTYSLSGIFEFVFGAESDIASLALDLETAISGYEDMVHADDIELAQSLIRELGKELTNAISKQ